MRGTNPRTLRCDCGCAWRMFPAAIDACRDGVHCPACRREVRMLSPVDPPTRAAIAAAVAEYVERAPEIQAWRRAKDEAARMRGAELARMRGGA